MSSPLIIVYVPDRGGGVSEVMETICSALRDTGAEVLPARGMLDAIRLLLTSQNGILLASMEAAFLCPFARSSVYIFHGFPMRTGQPFLRRQVLRLSQWVAYSSSKKTVAVSAFVAAHLRHISGINVTAIIHNPNPFSKLCPSPNVSKEKRILYCGRIVDVKGVRFIVEWFQRKQLVRQGYTLDLVGEGAEDFVRSLKGEGIQLWGYVSREKKLELFQKAEFFISLHDYEPQGLVFMEAMAAGCKIICPISGGHIQAVAKYGAWEGIGNIKDCDELDLAFNHLRCRTTVVPPAFGFDSRTAATRYLDLMTRL